MYQFAIVVFTLIMFGASTLVVIAAGAKRNVLAAISGIAAVLTAVALIGSIIAYDNSTHNGETRASRTEACQIVASRNVNASVTKMSKADADYFAVLLDSASSDNGFFGVTDDTFCKNLAELSVRAETVASGDRSSMPGVEGSGK